MFSSEVKAEALRIYSSCRSIKETVRRMGYIFSRQSLYVWIKSDGKPPQKRKPKNLINTSTHPAIPTAEFKLKIIKRCFEDGEMVKTVAKEIGYSRQTIYYWRIEYIKKGIAGLMREGKAIPRGKLKTPNSAEVSHREQDIEDLRSEIRNLKLQVEILQESLKIIKKDLGVNVICLKNKEKKMIVDALIGKYELRELLTHLNFSRSSYYYQKQVCLKDDKYEGFIERIEKIFKENYSCYGYRRIYKVLEQQGFKLSEKIIRKLMRQKNLIATPHRRRKYSSYLGEISEAPPNVINRDFHADFPNQKWLTDITELSIPSGKTYLSVVIDCFDGSPVGWKMGLRPNAELVNDSLKKALKDQNCKGLVIHSDRGCHYRWLEWISLTERYGLVRSMSAKGCSPDNAGCESFWSHLKTECFYGKDFKNFTLKKFKNYIDEYMLWYSKKRIKSTLGYNSPEQYRSTKGFG